MKPDFLTCAARRAIRLVCLAALIAGISLPALAGPAGGPRATQPKSAATYQITGIADLHLRDRSARDARFVMSHLLGFDPAFTLRDRQGRPVTYYKVNDYQFIEVSPGWSGESEPRYLSLGFRATNVRALRAHLAAAGFHPGSVHLLRDGNLGFAVQDPEGRRIQFVQYLADSRTGKLRGKKLSPRRVGDVLIHTGYQVQSKADEDRFYKAALDFPELWYGGMQPGMVDWFDRRTPNGPDWLEYMLRAPRHASLRQRGVMNHFSIGVVHMQAAYRTLLARGWKPTQKPQIGKDGKWQLNLYTSAGTRIELMGPRPVQTPCCSPMKPGSW
jgi:hypothetical protein